MYNDDITNPFGDLYKILLGNIGEDRNSCTSTRHPRDIHHWPIYQIVQFVFTQNITINPQKYTEQAYQMFSFGIQNGA